MDRENGKGSEAAMLMAQPPDDAYVTRADLRAELTKFERRMKRYVKRSLARYATKEDLERTLARYATKEDLERTLERYATKEDLERMGRVLAWRLIGGMGVMLAATLGGMWGVVHTLVTTAG